MSSLDPDLKIQINDTFFKEELAKFPPIFQYLLTKETFMISTEFLKHGTVRFENNELILFTQYEEDDCAFIFQSIRGQKSIYKMVNKIYQNYKLYFDKNSKDFGWEMIIDNNTYGQRIRCSYNKEKLQSTYHLFNKTIEKNEFQLYLKEKKKLLYDELYYILIKNVIHIIWNYLNIIDFWNKIGLNL